MDALGHIHCHGSYVFMRFSFQAGIFSTFLGILSCDRENYFGRARQNVRQAFNALPDILSLCQTYFPVDNWQISVVILVFLVEHFMCVEPSWTKCPAMSELSAGHQQITVLRRVHVLSQWTLFGKFHC